MAAFRQAEELEPNLKRTSHRKNLEKGDKDTKDFDENKFPY